MYVQSQLLNLYFVNACFNIKQFKILVELCYNLSMSNRKKVIQLAIIFMQLSLLMTSSPDFIINQLYQGRYQVSQTGQTFDYLDSRSGNLQATFYSTTNVGPINSIEICFLDPKYMDQKVVLLQIQGIIAIDNGVWANNAHDASYTTKWNGREEKTYTQIMSSIIIISNTQSGDYQNVGMNITIISSNVQVTATLTYYDQMMSTLFYCLYVAGLVVIQIVCVTYLLKSMQQRNIANKISLITLCLCNFQDFSQLITHILYTMQSEVVNLQLQSGFLFFIVPSIAYLVIFIMFDMKLLFLTWRNHNMGIIDDPETLRKRLTRFYIQLYLGLIVFMALNYIFSQTMWMVILRSVFLIPQIIYNALLGNNPGFNLFYILGYVGIRTMIPLYNYTCPANRFLISPNMTLAVTIVSILIFEILLLLLQYKFGSRFFIPKLCMPKQFEYRQKITKTQDNKDCDCTICIQNIFSCDLKVRESLNQKLLDETVVLITPCGHKFHSQCLTEWINVKLECPTCRSPIPAL